MAMIIRVLQLVMLFVPYRITTTGGIMVTAAVSDTFIYKNRAEISEGNIVDMPTQFYNKKSIEFLLGGTSLPSSDVIPEVSYSRRRRFRRRTDFNNDYSSNLRMINMIRSPSKHSFYKRDKINNKRHGKKKNSYFQRDKTTVEVAPSFREQKRTTPAINFNILSKDEASSYSHPGYSSKLQFSYGPVPDPGTPYSSKLTTNSDLPITNNELNDYVNYSFEPISTTSDVDYPITIDKRHQTHAEDAETPDAATTAMTITPSSDIPIPTQASEPSWDSDKDDNERDDIIFGSICSTPTVLAPIYHDVSLRCDVWAPYGTTIKWVKDNRILRTEHYQNTQGISQNRTIQNLHSALFIDCVDETHETTYELRVMSPQGRSYIRQFTVVLLRFNARYLSDFYHIGRMCEEEQIEKRFVPRIHAFSKEVHAEYGPSLILPCRYDGDRMGVVWYYEDTPVHTVFEDVSVNSNGDLTIDSFSNRHLGVFICELISLDYDMYPSTALTSVQNYR